MRILVANSNTSPEVTEAVRAEAVLAASPGTEVVARHARFGARVVGTRTEAAVAGHALVDMLAEHAGACDAVLLAMSFDTGLAAAREMLDVPVLGVTEAACLAAMTAGGRFGLVVLGARVAQPMREMVEAHGFAGRLAGIEALAATPQDLLRDPAALHGAVADAADRLVERAGAEAVVLAGAVMAGLPRALAGRAPVPLVEGISAGVMLLEALVRLGLPKPRAGSFAPVPRGREAAGLGAALAGYFGSRP